MPARAGQTVPSVARIHSLDTSPGGLIAAVNNLRVANGRPAYSISPILMFTAQTQAQYMAATGTVSHYNAAGQRPYQRALDAGYPLAGDLSLGGFISENITAGNNKSVEQAVSDWQGDDPHLNTMLSWDLTEIGAGVAIVDGYVYYVIDCARPTTSGQQQVRTPVAGATQAASGAAGSTAIPAAPIVRTIVPNTPDADGKLYHLVSPGETLWLIAISYGVKIADLRRLNNMTEVEDLYPGRKLLVREGVTATPPTATPPNTPEPSITAAPTETSPPTPTLTPIPAAPVASDSSLMILGAIVLAALVLAGVLVRAGGRVDR